MKGCVEHQQAISDSVVSVCVGVCIHVCKSTHGPECALANPLVHAFVCVCGGEGGACKSVI